MLDGGTAQVGARAIVSRPRLYAHLDAGARRALTLVSAPAGAGKTMLVRSWLRDHAVAPGPVAWASIDRRDWNANELWREIARALGEAGATPGGSLPEELHTLPARLTLVIDDIHHLTSVDANAALATLLIDAPPGRRLIL